MALMEKPGWEALMKLAAMTISELNAQVAPGQNEYEKLRSVFTKEAKVEALKEFFQNIEDGHSLTGQMQ